MARKSSGGGWAVVFLLIIGAIASVPKEVWIGAGVIGGAIALAYLFGFLGGSKPTQPAAVPASPGRPADRVDRFRSRGNETPDSTVTSERCWIPPAGSFTVGGRTIEGGLVYVGSRLPAISGYGIEPAAIDPKLPVRRVGPAERMPYWPSYSAISPEARGEYLDWLAGGRSDPNVQMGCVFLFFYGLERRALHDIHTIPEAVSAELPGIEAEVKRLLSIYSGSGSFHGYATGFLDALRWGSATSEKLYQDDPPPPPTGWRHLSIGHKLALAQAARDGAPISAPWAYSWLMSDPMTSLRTPAERCPGEFRRLFTAMYNQRYEGGMKLPNNKTRLKLTYRPASGSFGGFIEYDPGNLPDVTVLERPIGALRSLASDAADALDGYSRFIGRNPDKRDSMDAVVLLPPLLWPRQSMINLMTWLKGLGLEREMQATRVSELMRHFPSWGAMNKDRAGAFAGALEHFGVGMEPDVRWGGPIASDEVPVVLFAIPSVDRGKKPSPAYSAAALTMQLAAAVSHADAITPEEEERLEESLEQLLHLQGHERLRLRAHLKWLIFGKPNLVAMKKRVASLQPDQREAIGSFVVGIAQSDRNVTPAEMKVLARVFRVLELPEEQLYSMAHAAATEPVTVRRGTAETARYKVPRKPGQPSAQVLDADRISALKEESKRVAAVLTTIFTESDEAQDGAQSAEKPPSEKPNSALGLDAEHSELVSVLCGRHKWSRSELEDLASDRGIMLDGAIERVNEAFLDKLGAPLVEGDDPVEINQEVVREMQPA